MTGCRLTRRCSRTGASAGALPLAPAAVSIIRLARNARSLRLNRKKWFASKPNRPTLHRGSSGAAPNLALAEDFVTDERRLSWQLACTKDYIDLPRGELYL